MHNFVIFKNPAPGLRGPVGRGGRYLCSRMAYSAQSVCKPFTVSCTVQIAPFWERFRARGECQLRHDRREMGGPGAWRGHHGWEDDWILDAL